MSTAPVRVHRRVEGPLDAPVLVLSNSLGTSLEMWEPQMRALAGLRVVRYDMRGHGRSPAPAGPYSVDGLAADLLALLDDVGAASAHLCGLSLGGLVSLAVAAGAPERVLSVTTISSAARFPNPERYRERAALVRAQGIGAVAEAVVGRWLTPEFAATHPDLAAQLLSMIAATPAEGYASCCETVAAADLTAELSKIQAPVLSVAAASDPSLPADAVRALAASVPDGTFAVVEGAAHLANVEQPAKIGRLIVRHVQATTPADARHRGLAVRRAVLGDEHVDAAIGRSTAFEEDFQDFITRYAWGDVWSRPGLDRRMRSAVTLAALVSLRAEGEIAMHVRAALGNGLSPAEIGEILLQLAVYAGVPAANTAFGIARRVLIEEGLLDAPAS